MENRYMKAIIWDGKPYFEGLRYGDFPMPAAHDSWVLVHNRACGICGSDVHILSGGHNDRFKCKENLPAVLGHELAGVVADCAENTGFALGDRVAVEAIHTCIDFGSSCPRCLSGETNHCHEGMTHVGLPYTRMLPGGYGEYSLVHKRHLYKLPDNVSFEEAALLDILVVNVHAVNIGSPHLGDACAVIGCGVVGLNLVQLLKASGALRIAAVCKYPFQAELARQLGATDTVIYDHDTVVRQMLNINGGAGYDQVYECVGGESDSIDEAIHICKPKGRVIMLGLFTGYRPLDMNTLMRREISILPSNSYAYFNGKSEYETSIGLLSKGVVDVTPLISHRFSPEDYEQALRSAMSKDKDKSIKVMFIRE